MGNHCQVSNYEDVDVEFGDLVYVPVWDQITK